MRKLIPVLALLVIIVGGLLYHRYRYVQAPQVRFRTAQVKKGTILSKVSCTGTLSAVTKVHDGCQVCGTIKELHADFNVDKDDEYIYYAN